MTNTIVAISHNGKPVEDFKEAKKEVGLNLSGEALVAGKLVANALFFGGLYAGFEPVGLPLLRAAGQALLPFGTIAAPAGVCTLALAMPTALLVASAFAAYHAAKFVDDIVKRPQSPATSPAATQSLNGPK